VYIYALKNNLYRICHLHQFLNYEIIVIDNLIKLFSSLLFRFFFLVFLPFAYGFGIKTTRKINTCFVYISILLDFGFIELQIFVFLVFSLLKTMSLNFGIAFSYHLFYKCVFYVYHHRFINLSAFFCFFFCSTSQNFGG